MIYGAGGLGKEIACLIHDVNQEKKKFNLLGFLDNDSSKDSWFGLPVLGDHTFLEKDRSCAVVFAFGNPHIKNQVVDKLNKSSEFPTLIHPEARIMSRTVNLGAGSIVTAGCVLTCDIKVGSFALINLNSTVGHDVSIGDFASIMCGVNVAGMVKIGRNVFVGSGANLLNGIKVGEGAKIGAGAVVRDNVASGETAVGVPARVI